MGTTTVFAELLDRPTKGLMTATFRAWNEKRRMGLSLGIDQPVRRVLAHVELDRTDEGAITWSEVKVAPATPLIGLSGKDLCGPKAYGVTKASSGGHAEHAIYDVVARP